MAHVAFDAVTSGTARKICAQDKSIRRPGATATIINLFARKWMCLDFSRAGGVWQMKGD